MKFKSHHYRPLPEFLELKKSEIHGMGIHTKEDLKAGTYMGVTHIWETNRDTYIRTPLGGFINHSDNPNCFLFSNSFHPRGEQRELIAIKPIKAGEEITVYYVWGYEDAEEEEQFDF